MKTTGPQNPESVAETKLRGAREIFRLTGRWPSCVPRPPELADARFAANERSTEILAIGPTGFTAYTK